VNCACVGEIITIINSLILICFKQFQSLICNYVNKYKGRDGRTNFILRINEKKTHITLLVHDAPAAADDDK
jgi:hypothetical protein